MTTPKIGNHQPSTPSTPPVSNLIDQNSSSYEKTFNDSAAGLQEQFSQSLAMQQKMSLLQNQFSMQQKVLSMAADSVAKCISDFKPQG